MGSLARQRYDAHKTIKLELESCKQLSTALLIDIQSDVVNYVPDTLISFSAQSFDSNLT